MIKKVTSPGGFRMLIGSRPYCSDPAWDGHVLPTPRQTVTLGQVTQGGLTINAMVTPTSPPVGMSGTLTVANNDFSTGSTEILLGDYCLINGVEYQVGALVANTATNIAAAINSMAGFSASALGAVVTIVSNETMGEIDFRVRHGGTITNFTPLAPNTGYLGGGDPAIGPPVLT